MTTREAFLDRVDQIMSDMFVGGLFPEGDRKVQGRYLDASNRAPTIDYLLNGLDEKIAVFCRWQGERLSSAQTQRLAYTRDWLSELQADRVLIVVGGHWHPEIMARIKAHKPSKLPNRTAYAKVDILTVDELEEWTKDFQ